jgi:hypothetical protein
VCDGVGKDVAQIGVLRHRLMIVRADVMERARVLRVVGQFKRTVPQGLMPASNLLDLCTG